MAYQPAADLYANHAFHLRIDLIKPSRTACFVEKRLFFRLVSPRESMRPSNLLPQLNVLHVAAPPDKEASNALMQLVDFLLEPTSSFPRPHGRLLYARQALPQREDPPALEGH
jgi:hypothetical protein